MAEGGNEIGDVLGIKPIAKAVEKVTGGIVDGTGAFLSRICLPAAEEFGLLLRDRVHHYRTQNIARLEALAAEKQEKLNPGENFHAEPRLVNAIVNEASWIDDVVVQDMWAGLLSSSCTEDGQDDSNLLFTNLLSQLTKLQARILLLACKRTPMKVAANGLLELPSYLLIGVEELVQQTGEGDHHRLDCEMDQLRYLGLLSQESGFHLHAPVLTAYLAATPLAVQLYVRCIGSRQSPIEFFDLRVEKPAGESVQAEA